MKIVEFFRIGDHGAQDVAPVKYPWARWMNGEQWGFDPEFFNSSLGSFRKRLKETARVADTTVKFFQCTIDNVTWVIFSYGNNSKRIKRQ